MGEFVVKNCTRPTDRHKINILKIYISGFFQAKTSPGNSRTRRSSPDHPQNPPKSTQKRPPAAPPDRATPRSDPPLDPSKARFDQLDRQKIENWSYLFYLRFLSQWKCSVMKKQNFNVCFLLFFLCLVFVVFVLCVFLWCLVLIG